MQGGWTVGWCSWTVGCSCKTVCFTAGDFVEGFTFNYRNKKVYECVENILSKLKNIRILSSLIYNL